MIDMILELKVEVKYIQSLSYVRLYLLFFDDGRFMIAFVV